MISLRKVFCAVLGPSRFDTLSLRVPGSRKAAAELEADEQPKAAPGPRRT